MFLYCQQHAREWATPLTCLETAEQLLRNYGTDKTTRKLLDTLDIFILPSSNPDGAHYSMHNFNMPAQEHDQLVHVRRPRDRRSDGGELLDRKARPDHGDAVRVQRLGGAQRPGVRT